MFGLLGVLVIELFQTWQLIERKVLEVDKQTMTRHIDRKTKIDTQNHGQADKRLFVKNCLL